MVKSCCYDLGLPAFVLRLQESDVRRGQTDASGRTAERQVLLHRLPFLWCHHLCDRPRYDTNTTQADQADVMHLMALYVKVDAV